MSNKASLGKVFRILPAEVFHPFTLENCCSRTLSSQEQGMPRENGICFYQKPLHAFCVTIF